MSLSCLSLSQEPGVYLFLNKKGEIIYVGKAKNLKNRVKSYFVNKKLLGYRTKLLLSQTEKIKTIIVFSEIESLLLEANLIKKYKPFFNIKMIDGKCFPHIRITLKDKIPKVLVQRKHDDEKSIYLGPFPDVKALKSVLKTIRRVFPFQSVLNHPKKKCLHHHLGLCPCPPLFLTDKERKAYKKNIGKIVQFLKGNMTKIINDLEKERDKYAGNQEYEQANKAQEKIKAVKEITLQTSKPFEYDVNPNLREDLKQKETNDLQLALVSNGVHLQKLEKIECFDVSNTDGHNSTGSMVVFVKAEKNTSLHRRFKIKGKFNKPNDCAMIAEIIERRFHHEDWSLPDLIIVDGGKGQISSAKKSLNANHMKIPIVGLAKKEEVLITEEFKHISLSRNSPALNLIIRIRDEAHRFAVVYHRKLRSKARFSIFS